jgi:hypothetical protein
MKVPNFTKYSKKNHHNTQRIIPKQKKSSALTLSCAPSGDEGPAVYNLEGEMKQYEIK